jgi:hypothetical protein
MITSHMKDYRILVNPITYQRASDYLDRLKASEQAGRSFAAFDRRIYRAIDADKKNLYLCRKCNLW